MMKILNRIVLVCSPVLLSLDVIGIFQGKESSLPWAMLMLIVFLNSLRAELESKGK